MPIEIKKILLRQRRNAMNFKKIAVFGFSGLLSLCLWSVPSFADFNPPKACMDLMNSEMKKYQLGDVDHPEKNVDKESTSYSITFRSIGPAKLNLAMFTDALDHNYPYVIHATQFDIFGLNRREKLDLRLDANCSIGKIEFGTSNGPVTLDAKVCKVLNFTSDISKLDPSDRHTVERDALLSLQLCRTYAKHLADAPKPMQSYSVGTDTPIETTATAGSSAAE
jgi:hypothetical protein